MNSSPGTGRLLFPGPPALPEPGAPWRLSWYVLWRALGALLIVFLFLTLLFYVVEVVPGDPTRVLLPRGALCSPYAPTCSSRTVIDQWGLDKPLFDRYVIFLTNILTGKLGVSTTLRPGVPVWDVIAGSLPATLAFIGVTMIVLALLSLPIGMRMSHNKGGLLDQILSLLLALPFAVPAMMLALVGLYLFAFLYPIFPLSLQPSPDPLTQFANELWSRVLPELVTLATSLGLYAWVVRDHPLRPEADLMVLPPGEWRCPKKTAGARLGGAVSRFLAALPILFPWTVGGALLGEAVFGINGAGLLLWNATQYQDFFVLDGLIVVFALLVVLPTVFIADVLHYWMTARWERVDATHVDHLRVAARDPLAVLWRVATSPLAVLGIALILGIVIMSVAAPVLVGPYPTYLTLAPPNLAPSSQHPLGTDANGRDIFALLVYGGQPLLSASILGFALALGAAILVTLGIGFFGERGAAFLVLPVDLFLILSVPFAIVLVSIAGRDTLVWAPALVAWPVVTRLLLLELSRIVPAHRERIRPRLSMRERGERSIRLVWGAGPLLVGEAFLAVSLSILTWATFGVIGLGVVGPGAVESWGQMVGDAFVQLAILRGMWWYFVPPILCILLAVLGPTLLSLQLKRIAWQTPRNVILIEAPPPIVSVLPPGQSQ